MYFMEMKHARTFLYLFILRTNESSAVKKHVPWKAGFSHGRYVKQKTFVRML